MRSIAASSGASAATSAAASSAPWTSPLGVGISHQDLDSHDAFTAHHGLTVPLLADVDREVARAYGVSAPILGTRRATFVIDEDGIVRHRVVHTLGLDFQSADDLAEALDSL